MKRYAKTFLEKSAYNENKAILQGLATGSYKFVK